MNELQITLLIVGGGGIAAMIGYNWWQDYRLRRQANDRFGQSDEDPLLKERVEPGLESSSDLFVEQTVENTLATDCDNRLFASFFAQFEEPLDVKDIQPLLDKHEKINKKALLYSVSEGDGEQDQPSQWFDAKTYQGLFKHLRLNVQLANRKGALTSIEFSEIVKDLRHVADAHKGHLEFAEMKDIINKAETLDEAAAALDTVVGLHCMMPNEVEEAIIVDRLASAGWSSKGRQWKLLAEAGEELAAMVIHKAPGKLLLSFSIDVPNSTDPVKALGDIVTLCHSLNQEYGAPLMDDSGQVLSTDAIQGIYEQLSERVGNLVDAGFPPGSHSAKILFS